MIRSVKEWIDVVKEQYNDRTAIILEDGTRISYKELLDQSMKVTKALKASGIQSGDHVCVWLPNCMEWILLEVACGMLGVTVVTLNPRYRSHELSYMIEQSDSKMFFFMSEYQYDDVLQELIPEIYENQAGKTSKFGRFPLLQKAVCVNGTVPGGAWGLTEFVRQFGAAVHEEQNHFEIVSDESQTLNILYTSGTTSKPKGAMLSQLTILGHSYQIAERQKIFQQDVCMILIPFCGIFGLNSLWSVLLKGAAIIPVESFEPERICQLIKEYQVTVMNGVDQMYMKLMEYRNQAETDLSSLRIGAAGMFIYDGLEIMNQFEEGLSYRILHTYGMTEVGSMLYLRNPMELIEKRAVSGGIPVTGKVKIIDPESLEELSDGTVGEMIISGINVMSGYYKKPEINEKVFLKNGFFRTGDLGVKFAGGTVEYHGRLKEGLRLSGFLVAPGEIEDFLTELDDVELAQVVGVEVEQKTTVIAFIQLKPSVSLTADEIHQYCKDKLAHFKRPHHIFIVDHFPKSHGSNGEKIMRDRLVEMAKSNLKINY